MPHDTPLVLTIVASLGLAFVFGAIAQRLRLPPLAGYLLAGIAAGPFTPGFVADQKLALELAEIGVILLMFGVGLHFSLKDLLSVKAIAVPGAIAQIGIATLLGMGLAWKMGWSAGGGLVFGLSLSVASTVVLLRALEEQRLMETERGRIAVGWLIVEDLAMIVTLVMLPALAGLLGGPSVPASATGADTAGAAAIGTAAAGAATAGAVAAGAVAASAAASSGSGAGLLATLGLTLLRVAAFVALMLVVGRRVIPWTLHYVVHTGSRELFSLSVLAIALGVAFGSAALFGVSFALGAFFAGMVMSESTLTQRAAQETLPLRDAFAVLFFVSVGMLFDPAILLRDPWAVVATTLIIVLGKSIAALLIVLAFRRPLGTALTISASLAQIGEFSFILAGMGIALGLLPPQGRDLVLAGAIVSILLNPLLFALLGRCGPGRDAADADAASARAGSAAVAAAASAAPAAAVTQLSTTQLSGHVVLVGFGRVGSLVADRLASEGLPLLIIEDRNRAVLPWRRPSLEVIFDSAAKPDVLRAANLAQARWLLVAIPDGFAARQIVMEARKLNPALEIVARAHTDADAEHLERHGATLTVMGEREIARGMIDYTLGDRQAAAAGPP